MRKFLKSQQSNILSLICTAWFQPLTLFKLYEWHIHPRWPGSPEVTFLACLFSIFVLQVCLAPATIKREPHDNSYDSLVNMATCSTVLFIGWVLG